MTIKDQIETITWKNKCKSQIKEQDK